MHKIIYISFLLIFFLSPAQAQKKYIYQDSSLLQKEDGVFVPDKEEKTETVPIDLLVDEIKKQEAEKTDTSLYENNLNLAFDSIQHWKSLKEYAYVNYLDSLLKDRKAKTKRVAEELPEPGLMNSFFSSAFLRVLLWVLAIGFVLFIIYRLFLADGVFRRETKLALTDKAGPEEELITNESNFDALIEQSVQNSNYRQAVRYQYLKTLHILAGKKFIEPTPDKTNFQYVQEIQNREYQNEFAALTLNYGYVWYGEFVIDKNVYQKIEKKFDSLNKKL